MSNHVMEKPRNLPANLEAEADNILAAADENTGFEKRLKFKKGKYFVDDDEIPIGRQYLAHASQWVKCWTKFSDGKVADRRMGKVAIGYTSPKREELDDTDQSKWEVGLDGKPRDPWVFQHLLPMEDMETGDICIFTTSSVGGHRAIADLCKAYGKRLKKGLWGLPIVSLAVADMPTKAFGDVRRPDFVVTGWDDAAGGDDIKVINTDDDMSDSIPF